MFTRPKNSCIKILFFKFRDQMFTKVFVCLYKKTICELQSVKFLHSMNYCALSHYLKGDVANKT